MKQTKLQKLTIAFESIGLKESETFDEFNVKLSDIVNPSFNLGEPSLESKVVKKMLLPLPTSSPHKIPCKSSSN